MDPRQDFSPRNVLTNVIGAVIKAEQEKREQQKLKVAAVATVLAAGAAKRGRTITPAPAPALPPPVVELPHTGVGTAPPVPVPVMRQDTPPVGGGGAVVPPNPPSLGDNIGYTLGPIANAVGGAVANKVEGGLSAAMQEPVTLAGNPKDNLLQVASGGLSAPQNAQNTLYGEIAYQTLKMSGKTGTTIPVLMTEFGPAGLLPDMKDFMMWTMQHPEKVIVAHDKGFTDGAETWSGGKAVWQAFIKDTGRVFDPNKGVSLPAAHLPGQLPILGGAEINIAGISPENIPAIFTGITSDPSNLFGGELAGAGKALAEGGIKQAAEGGVRNAIEGNAARAIGRAAAAPDQAYMAAVDTLTKTLPQRVITPAMRAAGETRLGRSRVGEMVKSWAELSPRARAQKMLGEFQGARAQKKRAQEVAGRTVFDPADRGITPMGNPIEGISPPDITPTNLPNLQPKPKETPAGWLIREEVDAGAPNILRTLIGEEGKEVAHVDLVKRRANDERTWKYMVRFVEESPNSPGGRTVGRGKGFDNMTDALAFVDQKLGPNPEKATLTAEQQAPIDLIQQSADAAPVATVPKVYEEARSPRKSNREMAEKRFFDRTTDHVKKAIDANDPELERELLEIRTQAIQDRGLVLEGTSGPEDALNVAGKQRVFGDVENDANRFTLWEIEHDADRRMREALEARGIDPGPYRNTQPMGEKDGSRGIAGHLDNLAWNPDKDSVEKSAGVLEQELNRLDKQYGDGNLASAMLDSAIDTAITNREKRYPITPEVPAALRTEETDAAADAITSAGEDVPRYLRGLQEGDRQIFTAGVNTPGPRQNEFKVLDQRLSMSESNVNRVFDNPASTEQEYLDALTSYKQAHENSVRLVEQVKRENDYMDRVFMEGGTTPAVTQAVQSVRSQSPVGAPKVGTFSVGPIIAPETEDVLNRTFSANNIDHAGRTHEVVYNEIEQKVANDKNRLVQLLTVPRATLEKKEQTELDRLMKDYGIHPQKAAEQALNLNVEEMANRGFRQELYKDIGYEGPTRLGRALDTYSRVFSSINLLTFKFPAYYLGNLTGDTWQVALVHGPEAARAANNWDNIKNLTRFARKGGDPLEGSVGDLVRGAELGGFHQGLVGDNLTEAMYANQNKVVRRAGGKARIDIIGGIDDATSKIINPMRNISNGLEWAHRTGLWAWSFEKRMMNATTDFVTEMAPLLQKHGIQEDEATQMLEALGPIKGGSKVAHGMGELAFAKGVNPDEVKGFAEEMGRKWQSRVNKANDAAVGDVNKALFSFEQTGLDVGLRRIIPYHMWMSRAYPFYAEQALRHPGLSAAYYNLHQNTQEQADKNGWTGPVRDMIQLTAGPSGLQAMINPFAFMGLMDMSFENNGGYTDENMGMLESALKQSGEVGFNLLPLWQSALGFLGVIGNDSGGLDPFGTYNFRKYMGTGARLLGEELGINWLASAGKPYEQMLSDLRGVTSRVAETLGVPGAEWVPPTDVNLMPVAQIRNIMLRNRLKEDGVSMNEFLAVGMRAEADPTQTGPDATYYNSVIGGILDEEMSNGADYQWAKRELARQDMFGNLIGAVAPGPKSMRQEDYLALQSLNSSQWAAGEGRLPVIPGVGIIPEDGYDPSLALRRAGGGNDAISEVDPKVLARMDPRDVEFLTNWANTFGQEYRTGDIKRLQNAAGRIYQFENLTPQAATLVEQQNAYSSLGTEAERKTIDDYYSMAFGETAGYIESQNFFATSAQMKTLDADTRWKIADAWLAENDPSGDIRKLIKIRDMYSDTHPEYGGYRTWRSETNKQWGNAQAFRESAVKSNPSYAYYIKQRTAKYRKDGLSPSEMLEKLDSDTYSMDAYMAYQGIPKTRYSPEVGTGAPPLPLASEGATGSGLGGGTTGGGSTDVPVAERVQAALLDGRAVRQEQIRILGVDPNELIPQMRDQVMKELPESALPGSDYWIYEEFRQFSAAAQQSGGDGSVEAFIKYFEEQYAQPEELLPSGEAIGELQPNTWPPVPIS